MSAFYTGTPATAAPTGAGEFNAALLQATLTTRKVQALVALAWSGPQFDAYSVSLGVGEKPDNGARFVTIVTSWPSMTISSRRR